MEGLDVSSLFGRPDQTWAWAHVHVSQNIIGASLQSRTEQDVSAVEQNLQQALLANSDMASSRLLCARKLEKSRAYHAFVIPAFEAGRLAVHRHADADLGPSAVRAVVVQSIGELP